MAVRSIQYLVVDDVMADVPDGAPEIDASVQTAADVAAALTSAAGVPPGAEIYLQTFRPDGSMRWQPLASVSSLPDMPCLRAKVLRRQPGHAVRPAAGTYGHPVPGTNPVGGGMPAAGMPQQAAAAGGSGGGGLGRALGGLLKRVVLGGGGGGGSGAGRPTGGGRVQGGGGAGGFGGGAFSGPGRRWDDEDEFERQRMEQQALGGAAAAGMVGGAAAAAAGQGWVQMDNSAGPEPQEFRDSDANAGCDRDDGGWQGMRDGVGVDADGDGFADGPPGAGLDADGDGFADEPRPDDGGDWQDMDNNAGQEPDDGDDDNDYDDNDGNDGGSDGGGGNSD